MENTKNVLYKIFVCIVGFLTFIAVCILIAWYMGHTFVFLCFLFVCLFEAEHF